MWLIDLESIFHATLQEVCCGNKCVDGLLLSFGVFSTRKINLNCDLITKAQRTRTLLTPAVYCSSPAPEGTEDLRGGKGRASINLHFINDRLHKTQRIYKHKTKQFDSLELHPWAAACPPTSMGNRGKEEAGREKHILEPSALVWWNKKKNHIKEMFAERSPVKIYLANKRGKKRSYRIKKTKQK